MPFEISDAINNIGSGLTSNPTVNTIFKNPFYFSILLTFVLVLTVMFILGIAGADVPNYSSVMLKTFFYILIGTSVFVWLHNLVVISDIEKKSGDEDVVRTITGSMYSENFNNYTPQMTNMNTVQPNGYSNGSGLVPGGAHTQSFTTGIQPISQMQQSPQYQSQNNIKQNQQSYHHTQSGLIGQAPPGVPSSSNTQMQMQTPTDNYSIIS